MQGGRVRRAWLLRVVAAGQLGVGRRVHLEIRALLRGLQGQPQEIPQELGAVVQVAAQLQLKTADIVSLAILVYIIYDIYIYHLQLLCSTQAHAHRINKSACSFSVHDPIFCMV